MRRVPDSTTVPLAARRAYRSELRCTQTLHNKKVLSSEPVPYAIVITILSTVSTIRLKLKIW